MFSGGIVINSRTTQIIRAAALILPLILLAYGLLMKYHIVAHDSYAGDTLFLLIILPWILLAVAQFLMREQTRQSIVFRVVTYHIFSSLYILFVSGFSTPFIAAWILLFLGSYMYFSYIGLRLSIAALVITGLINIAWHLSDPGNVSSTIMAVVATLAVGLSIASLGRAQEVNNAELSRSKAEQNLQRERILTIINNLADAVLSTDKHGIIRVYNAASLNLLDTNESLNTHHISKVLSLHDTEGTPVDAFGLLKGSRGVVVRDDLAMTIDNETIRLEVTSSPIHGAYNRTKRSTAEDGYVLIFRDITKAKSLEEERDEFISVVSHELRTPITIAEGTISNVQLMLDRPNVAAPVLKSSIATAHDQVIYLAKMVNDLSTLSRAERGVADTPESINVRTLVNDLYKEYAPQADKKKLHFDLDLASHLGQVNASPLYLKELLQNFITNALKYTKEGGLTLGVERTGDELTFAVKDTGIGISKTDQAKVFNKFYRSEDYRTRETGGTGLGLYVAAKLSKKLGTQIKLTSRLNHGSTFSFSLPAEPANK